MFKGLFLWIVLSVFMSVCICSCDDSMKLYHLVIYMVISNSSYILLLSIFNFAHTVHIRRLVYLQSSYSDTLKWTYSLSLIKSQLENNLFFSYTYKQTVRFYCIYIACPRCSDPFYRVSYYIKWVTTSWTHSI